MASKPRPDATAASGINDRGQVTGAYQTRVGRASGLPPGRMA
jgi:hypothetical protein